MPEHCANCGTILPNEGEKTPSDGYFQYCNKKCKAERRDKMTRLAAMRASFNASILGSIQNINEERLCKMEYYIRKIKKLLKKE